MLAAICALGKMVARLTHTECVVTAAAHETVTGGLLPYTLSQTANMGPPLEHNSSFAEECT